MTCRTAQSLRSHVAMDRADLAIIARKAARGSAKCIAMVPAAQANVRESFAVLAQHEAYCTDCQEA